MTSPRLSPLALGNANLGIALGKQFRDDLAEMPRRSRRHRQPDNRNGLCPFTASRQRLHGKCRTAERSILNARVVKEAIQRYFLHGEGFIERRIGFFSFGHPCPPCLLSNATMQPLVPSRRRVNSVSLNAGNSPLPRAIPAKGGEAEPTATLACPLSETAATVRKGATPLRQITVAAGNFEFIGSSDDTAVVSVVPSRRAIAVPILRRVA